MLRDAIGRDWQCGTLQVDLNLPERLGAFYVGADGEKHHPLMLHRALFGSLERFTGILIEHYAGKLPLWMAPLQAVVATITSDADDYAYEVLDALKAAGIRAEIDIRNEKINYKVREHTSQGARAGGRSARNRGPKSSAAASGGKDQDFLRWTKPSLDLRKMPVPGGLMAQQSTEAAGTI